MLGQTPLAISSPDGHPTPDGVEQYTYSLWLTGLHPAEVTDVKVTNGSNDVTLDWQDPANEDFVHVEILYNTESGSVKLVIPQGVQSARILYLKSGTAVPFNLKTVDISGNRSPGIIVIGNPDYRNKYLGTWFFHSFYMIRYATYPPSSSADTTDYLGTVEKYGTDQLKIIYAPDYIEPNLEHETWPLKGAVYGLLYPTVYPGSDNLGYPGMPSRYGFAGHFTGIDSVSITFYHPTHSGGEEYFIYGRKMGK